MSIKNKTIKLDDNTGILTVHIEMEKISLARDKKSCMYTQDVVDLVKNMGYDVQSVLQHASISNFREPFIGEWKFLSKIFKKSVKTKKVEKQIDPPIQSSES